MKKETSRKVSLVKSFLIIPIAAILLLGFSEKEILEIQKEGTPQEQQTLLSGIKKELENVDALKLNYTEEKEQIIELYIKKNAEILIHNTPVLLKDLALAIENEIQPDVKLENIRIEGLTEDTLESEFMFSITTEIRKANIKQIKFCTSEYIMDAADYKDEIEITPETIILNTNKIVLQSNKISEFNNLAKKYNAIPIEKRMIPLKDLYLLETIYRNMSPAQKEAAQAFPECLPKAHQEGATKKQITAYNDLAKKYNTMMAKGGNIRIVKSDVDQLKHIYELMSEEQKGNAQPFPDFPEPPPAPQVPEAQNEREEAAKTIKRIIEEQDPYDTNTLKRIEPSVVNSPKAPMAPIFLKDGKFYQSEVAVDKSNTIKINGEKHYYINDNGTSRIYNRFGQRVTNNGQIIDVNEQPIEIIEVVEVPSAPEPPTPPSPLDYVINAAKKGATFMYEGKIVSSDKAIDLLKNNKELNIESRNKNGKQIVRITKDPVTIE